MDSPLNEHIDPELLIRFLSGDANAQEKIEITHWINASTQHKAYFEQMTLLWSSGANAKDIGCINVKADWQKVRERLNVPEKTEVIVSIRKQNTVMDRLIRIAAVVLFLTSLFFVWLLFTRQAAPPITIFSMQGQSQATLPDGSKVFLNKNSALTYPKEFDGQTREVKLVGEAFFEVAKNENKPFLIRSGTVITKVLGTSFNVHNTNAGKVTVSVSTGNVIVYDEENDTQIITLTPGEQGIVDKGRLVKSAIQDVNFLSWKTGVLTFYNTSLSQVIDDINRHYDQSIILKSHALPGCRLTTTFNRQSLEDVLEEIKLVLPIQFEKTGEQIVINGNRCNQTQ